MISPARAGVTLGLGLLVTHSFGLSLVPALLPNIAASLSTGYAELGIAVAAGLLAYSAGALVSGRLLEQLPNRAVLLATLSIPIAALIGVSRAESGVTIGLAVALLGVNAGVSWPVCLHAIAQTTPLESRTAVMSGAGAGVGLGLIVNGGLVHLVGTTLTWQEAVLAAAAMSLIPVALAAGVFRQQIASPVSSGFAAGGFRAAASTVVGKVIFLAGLSAGMLGFPLVAFLSVVAREEMGATASEAAWLWWLTGAAGIAVSPLFGRIGQRRNPLYAMTAGGFLFLGGLTALALTWNYLALATAAVALTAYYYPVWGLVGSMANSVFDSGVAVRSVALGLVGASIGGAIGNSGAGFWYDGSGSFRGPIAVMIVGMAATVGVFLWARNDPKLVAVDSGQS